LENNSTNTMGFSKHGFTCLSLTAAISAIYRNSEYCNKKLSYLRDNARCENGYSRSFKVIRPLLCQSTRHIWLPISTQ